MLDVELVLIRFDFAVLATCYCAHKPPTIPGTR